MADPVLSARSRVANLHRRRACDPAQLAQAKRELTALNLERAIQRALDAAPPLTDEARSRLAQLLTSGGAK